jgi:hypothetical protein
MDSRHGSGDHLTFESSKAPCLSSELYNPPDCNPDALFFLRVGKVFDLCHDLINNCASSSVDSLLSTAARKCSKKCLLAPDSFLAGALITNVVAHSKEE